MTPPPTVAAPLGMPASRIRVRPCGGRSCAPAIVLGGLACKPSPERARARTSPRGRYKHDGWGFALVCPMLRLRVDGHRTMHSISLLGIFEDCPMLRREGDDYRTLLLNRFAGPCKQKGSQITLTPFSPFIPAAPPPCRSPAAYRNTRPR